MTASGDVTARKADEIIQALIQEGLLRPVHDGEDQVRFAFVEDGLPTLIWMTWAQRNLLQAAPGRTRAAAASAP